LDRYGNDLLLSHHDRAWKGQGDWIITLYDVWPLDREHLRDARIASWVPVDHMPAPPAVVAWCREHLTIAMSQYGQGQLQAAGIDALYAPHAVDRAVYKPTPGGRHYMGIPDDAFVVMIAAANAGNHPPRKAWGQQIFAVSEFARRHPDVHLYLHTDEIGYQGVDLRALIASTIMDPKRVHFVDQYAYRSGVIDGRGMAALYSAADVLLFATMGEGFGVPAIEAQACGTPPIVSDFSAQTELAGAGWKVGVEPWWDHAQGAWLCVPKVAGIIDALEGSYAERGQRSEAAVSFAAQYDADAVFETYWLPVLTQMARTLVAPRAVRRAKKRGKAA
jgi:glycosyltransferase involved in cell wall biosynthesis